MAIKRITIRVCDVCADDTKEVSTVRVSGDLGRKTLDLCDDHVAPIRKLVDPLPKTPKTRRRAPVNAKRVDLDAATK